MTGFLGRDLDLRAAPTANESLDRVVVCGAGPVGLTAALTLVRAGVPVTVFEKLPALSTESRASTFHPPTLELLDELGVAGEVVRSRSAGCHDAVPRPPNGSGRHLRPRRVG